MKQITHWLQLGGIKTRLDNEKKQWSNLVEYNKNNECEITIYKKNTGDMYATIVKLMCNQKYNDLELDCNAGDGSIKHLNSRPNNIDICKKQLDYFTEEYTK